MRMFVDRHQCRRHRDINVLSFPGSVSVMERGQHSNNALHPGINIRVGKSVRLRGF